MMSPKMQSLVILASLFTLTCTKAVTSDEITSPNQDSTFITVNKSYESKEMELTPIYKIANQTIGRIEDDQALPEEIKTYPAKPFEFIPAGDYLFEFKVRTQDSAHIALVPIAIEAVSKVEILLGFDDNTKTIIWKDNIEIASVVIATPDILSDNEFRGFWIQWAGNTISVGHKGKRESFLSVFVEELFKVSHMGLKSKFEASWIVRAPVQPPRWVPASRGDIPYEAFSGGEDGGQIQYVARSLHGSGLLPGKLVPSRGTYVAWDGREHLHDSYEVLCGCKDCQWVSVTGNQVPSNAIFGGETESKNKLYVGRVNYQGTVTLGRVLPSLGLCYIPYGGRQLVFSEYEVLTSLPW